MGSLLNANALKEAVVCVKKPISKNLTDEEQRYHIKLAQAGDGSAKEFLVMRNQRLVYSLVQRFLGRGYEKEDLSQVGNIGLIKAVENFDLNYANCFSTYAVPMIMGEIKRFIRDDQPVHVSRSYKELAYKISKVKEAYLQENDKAPTMGQIADTLGITVGEVVVALEANQRPTSLQSPIENGSSSGGSGSSQLQDLIPNNDSEEQWVDSLQLKQVFAKLPPRLQYIMNVRYFKEATQEEVAKTLGVSQVQISRLEKQALKALKELLQE